MQRRQLVRSALLLPATVGATGWLAGCATLQTMSAEVASFGEWPAERKGGSYAFDRLPSQQARADEQQALEDAAGAALARAGFTPAAAGATPELMVQVGARVSRADRSPWDDPLWWQGGWGVGRRGPWRGAYWGVGGGFGGLGGRWEWSSPRYEREVALLLREQASGKPLYEARASSEGYSSSALLGPLFDAALAEFPAVKPDPHAVRVPLTR